MNGGSCVCVCAKQEREVAEQMEEEEMVELEKLKQYAKQVSFV